LDAAAQITPNGDISLRSATNGIMKSVGSLQWSFIIAGTLCTHVFCVLRQLPYDVILGMDFLHHHHVILDGRQRRLSFASPDSIDELNVCELQPVRCAVSLAANQCVPAGKTRMLRLLADDGALEGNRE
jgi:hypothetical protein